MFFREQTVGGQAFLELPERELQGARAYRLHGFDDELILAASFVDRKRPRAITRRPSSGTNRIIRFCILAGASQRGGLSLSEKYQ